MQRPSGAWPMAWRDDRDVQSLHRLINAYMRLAISMAAKFKRYGAPMNDLIQEAGLGLMKAADKFDPDRGVRFSTYAVWWIKASIQDYVMRNWSMVRTGSTSSQKSLFFNMRRVQAQFEREARASGVKLDRHQLHQKIATEIGVPLRDVEMMEGRLSGADFSLNAIQSADEEGREWIDALEDEASQAEELVQERHDRRQLRKWLVGALQALNDRERFIITERKLREQPAHAGKPGHWNWACPRSGCASWRQVPSRRCANALKANRARCTNCFHEKAIEWPENDCKRRRPGGALRVWCPCGRSCAGAVEVRCGGRMW